MARRLVLFALLLAAAPTWAAEAGPPERPPASRLANLLLVADRPIALFWAEGCVKEEDLPLYRTSGLNTLVVEVREGTTAELAAARHLLDAAGRQGLFRIVRLAPSPAGFPTAGGRVAPALTSAPYRQRLASFAQACVTALRTPDLLAWEVAAVDADYVLFNQADFTGYLDAWYGTLDKLRAAWGVADLPADSFTEDLVRRIDREKPLGVGQPTIDLVTYRQQRYHDLLGLWAAELRRLDPGRLVLAGAIHNYRSALAVPRACDGMVLSCFPGQVEADPEWHDPQAIDFGRRGNAFAALQTIQLRQDTTAGQLGAWVRQAALHGAAGIGLADWPALRANEALRAAAGQAFAECRRLGLMPRTPAPQVAVLAEPWAAGGMVGQRALYGHMAGLSTTEPGALLYALRAGCRFGTVDILGLPDLEQAESLPYRLILAPLALRITDQARSRLLSYAAAGGIVFADGDFGRFDGPGRPARPIDSLQALFGLAPPPAQPGPAIPILGIFPHPLFPSLGDTARALPDLTASPITADVHYLFAGPDTRPVVALRQHAPLYAGIFARPLGKGWGVYASGRLWDQWLPGRPFFEEMVGDLLGRAYDFAVASPPRLVGGPTVGRYSDGSLSVLDPRAGGCRLLVQGPPGRMLWAPGGVQEIRDPALSPLSALTLPPAGLLCVQPIPITVVPQGPRVLLQVGDYSNKLVRLVAFGPDSALSVNGDKLVMAAAGRVKATFSIHSGLYPIAPGSKHQLRVGVVSEEQPTVTELTADDQGTITFPLDCDLKYITIAPAGAEAPSPTPAGSPAAARPLPTSTPPVVGHEH